MALDLKEQVSSVYQQRVERYFLHFNYNSQTNCNLCGSCLPMGGSYMPICGDFYYYIAPFSRKPICNDCICICKKCGDVSLKLYDFECEREHRCDLCLYNETFANIFRDIGNIDIHYYLSQFIKNDKLKILKGYFMFQRSDPIGLIYK